MTGAPKSILIYGCVTQDWHRRLIHVLQSHGHTVLQPANQPMPLHPSLAARIERATLGRLFADKSEAGNFDTPPLSVSGDTTWLGINLSGSTQLPDAPFPARGWLTPILQPSETTGAEDCLLFWQDETDKPAKLIAHGLARSFPYSWTQSDRRAGSHLAYLTSDWINALTVDRAALPNALPEPPQRRPRNWASLFGLVIQTLRRIVEQKLTHEQWHVLYHPSPPLELPQSAYHRLIPPKDRFWADPFAVSHQGKTVLFVEELAFEENHGRLIALQVEGDQVVQEWPVLDFPYHSSYPFVVRHQGRLFMVPETAANNSVELYECQQFPGDWVRVKTLLDQCNAGDSSIIHRNGTWFLFTNVGRGADESYCNELHLFIADDLLTGNFTPHPASPVSRDCRTARMGGGFFEKDGDLYRVAQKGNGRIYGEALNLMRVTELSPTGYAETFVRTIEPDGMDGLIGLHHMSYHDGITAMDALKRIRK